MMNYYRQNRPTIGVLIGWHVYWNPTPYSYLNPIFRGIRAAVRDKDCNLLLACGMGSQTNANTGLPAWPLLSPNTDFAPVGPWNTDGLIVLNPLAYQELANYTDDLRKSGFPIFFVANGGGEPAILADNVSGIFLAIQHLVEKHGHKRIVFIAGSPKDVNGDSGDRLKAYVEAVEKFGLDTDPELLIYGYHTFDGGYAAIDRLRKANVAFSAVLASNDESAMGAMQAIKEAGLRIPQDMAVIGFDDRPEAMAQEPPLTSIHIPLYTSGYQAVERLLQQIHGNTPASPSFKVSTTLTIRQSCGCNPDTDILSLATVNANADDAAAHKAKIVQAMSEAVLAETQLFTLDEIRASCEHLRDAFIASLQTRDPLHFRQQVEDLLKRADADDDDAHIWQSVVSILRQEVPMLTESLPPDASPFAFNLLDQTRNTISERMRRQRGRTGFYHKWLINRIGYLTAHLLMTSTEAQIFEVLYRDLPKMAIQHVSLSFFEADGDDPVAWSMIRAVPAKTPAPIRFRTRQFPPEEIYPADQPFSLMLMPIVSPHGQTGFITYDSIDIELDGPITQQIAAALNNVNLYREATEGRKLAEEANSLKSRFLSMVSHELRTPLNLIVGLSDMILQKREQGSRELPIPYRKDIEQIYSSAQHLGRLIRDVLDLASSQVGQLYLANELIDLNETLQMVAATGRQMAAEKGIGWQDSIPETNLLVWGDRTRLRQVALNLVSNAIKFTTHGQVRLQVEVRAGEAFVLVSDTGMGIVPSEQSMIFDEFRRSEQAQGYGGMGLGLAISKRLIEMHGGRIGVKSSGKAGAGSTFHFCLPLVQSENIQWEDQLPLEFDELVLLFTTPLGSGEQLRNHLVKKGVEVKMVAIEQGESWLPPLLKTLPGAIVLDLAIMPVQGWNVLKAIKENPVTQSVPLLFYSLDKDKGAILELDYLIKPIETAELVRALEYQKINTEDSKATKCFLIVDDDPATLEMHVRIVQSQPGKHQILRARNGLEALEVMHDHTPDLILLDLMMPELDGFGVLEAMREKDSLRNIPVIVLTGQMLTEKEMAQLNQGVAVVLEKGMFSVEETLQHIDDALVRKRRLGNAAQRLVRQAMAYLHEHYAEEVSREALAEQLRVSGDYLTLCFRAEMGMTFVTYLNRYRVNQAKILLTDSDMSITKIAASVGFADSAYFSRVFRQHVGVSPDAYRRS